MGLLHSPLGHILWLVFANGEGGALLSLWVLLLLGLAWAVVLIPALTRPRFESSPLDGVRSFEQAMGILASTRKGSSDRQQMPGRWVMVPKGMGRGVKTRRQRVVRKRRAMFQRLLIASGATFVLGLIPAVRTLWWASLVFAVVTAGYAVMLRRWHLNELQRKRVVRHIPEEPVPVVDAGDPDEDVVILPKRAAR